MLKRVFTLLILSGFSLNSLTACGSSDEAFLLDNNLIENTENQNLQANSFLGVMKEIKNAGELAFKQLDKNMDNIITPDEYGNTEGDSRAFVALDKNHDGKITKSEFSPNFFNKIGLASRLRSAAKMMFTQLDTNKDKFLTRDELNSELVSSQLLDGFDKYDRQKKTLFHKDENGKLSLSEFEDLFANVSLNYLNTQVPTQLDNI